MHSTNELLYLSKKLIKLYGNAVIMNYLFYFLCYI